MSANQMIEKAVASTNQAQLLTQPGGIFAIPGAQRDLLSTFVTPSGLAPFLPAFAASDDDPRFGFWTGVGAESGTEADYPCDDGPTAIHTGGYLTASWGRIVRSTPTIELTRLLHTKRGVQTDLNLIGNVLAQHPLVTRNGTITPSAEDLVVAMEMIKAGVTLERKLSKMLWTGATANNTTNGGYKEFVGLDTQIGTGKVDVDSNTAMPAANSLVVDFNYTLYDDTTKDLVKHIFSVAYYLEDLAERTRMAPVTWAIVMRRELFHWLTELWPCRYYAAGCASGSVVMNNDYAVQQRDYMRSRRVLPINSKEWTVILDDGLPSFTNADNAGIAVGNFASGIRFVPLTVTGNMPATYWEYINYQGLSSQLQPLGMNGSDLNLWTDNGSLLWSIEKVKTCIKITGLIEPRIVLRAPQLAARIDNIEYPAMIAPLRGAFPDATNWQAGGVSSR